jgi:hypothetical protein
VLGLISSKIPQFEAQERRGGEIRSARSINPEICALLEKRPAAALRGGKHSFSKRPPRPHELGSRPPHPPHTG